MNNLEKIKEFDVAIIGAGPSGVAAAIKLAKSNLTILLIDSNEQVGGQIYKATPKEIAKKILIKEHDIQLNFQNEIFKYKNLNYQPNFTVWQISENFRIDAFSNDTTKTWYAKKIIVANGTHERVIPFKGWTEPGVIGLAASTIVFKSQQILPGKKIILAGSGPLLLASANYALKLGAEIIGIIDLKSKIEWIKILPNLFYNKKLMLDGFLWLTKIILKKIPIYSSSIIQSANRINSDTLEIQVSHLTSKKITNLQSNILCVGYGLIPQIDFSKLLNAKHIYNQDLGGWIPELTPYYETSVKDFYQVGDASGIMGAIPAYTKGNIAALKILFDLNKVGGEDFEKQTKTYFNQINQYKVFAKGIATISNPSSDLYELIDPSEVICRCEDVTKKEIIDATNLGAKNINQLKSWTRCGMGPCQGRTCGETASHIMARTAKIQTEDTGYLTGRAPVRPVPLHLAVGEYDYDKITKIEAAPL